MKIKTVCERTGLSDRAIRYYIEEGLISPNFSENYLGRKAFSFSEDDIAMLNDIATLRKFGFSIPDIKEMITDPHRILPLVHNLQQQKKQILSDESALLHALLSIDDGQVYTVSRLAAKLSAPVENKAIPEEDNTSRFWRKFGKACIFVPYAIFPGMYLCIGLYYLFHNTILNVAAIILYYILSPVALCLLAYFFAFNRKGQILYKGCSVTTVVFFVLSIFFQFCAETAMVKNHSGIHCEKLYSDSAAEISALPDLSEAGEFVNLEYYQVLQEGSIFSWESTCYIFSYTQEEYTIQRDGLEHSHSFQSEPIRDGESICEPSAEVDGYTFRLLSSEEYKGTLYYPKKVMLIGYSDQNREIAYLIYQDPDIDYISDLARFIRNDCGWRYMNRGILQK